MEPHCQISECIEKIYAASHCAVGILGGSLTTGVGASNTAETCWRTLFIKYLYKEYNPKYHNQVSEVMGAVGASESYAAVWTVPRHILPNNPDLTLVEFCVNDRGAPNKDLVMKGMEGIVRQLLCNTPRSDVMILGAGCRPGSNPSGPNGCIDHTLHRRIADHYDLPFVDMQSYLYRKLEETGKTWDDIAIEFEEKDNLHLNDLGNLWCFEALRDEFERQRALYDAGKRKPRRAPVPPPLVSDELQFIQTINPAKPAKQLTLEGDWEKKPDGLVPWYFDDLMMGKPGAKMTLRFKGTACAVWGLMYNNGLKLNAVLDGKEIAGPLFRHFIEFGKGFVLAHGLPNEEHVLELTVGEPSKRFNRLENPTAQVAYVYYAAPPEGK